MEQYQDQTNFDSLHYATFWKKDICKISPIVLKIFNLGLNLVRYDFTVSFYFDGKFKIQTYFQAVTKVLADDAINPATTLIPTWS